MSQKILPKESDGALRNQVRAVATIRDKIGYTIEEALRIALKEWLEIQEKTNGKGMQRMR